MLPEYDINTFFPLFSSYTYKLCNDRYSIEYSTQAVLQDFQNDGVVYLELRTTPRAVPEDGMTKRDYVQTILTILQNHNNNPENTMRVYLILSVDRRNSASEADQVVDLALECQSAGVVGLDLCGDCSKGDVRIFSGAFARAKTAGLKITLHFAEVEASATDGELETLLSFQPDRLGHVIQVKDRFRDQIEKDKIGVELCLSCNVQAKMISGSYPDHHFGTWRHTSVPLALSTDDVGVFGSPLSREYYLASTHFGLDQDQLKALAERPIPSIFGGDGEKARLYKLFSQFRT
ncbi:Metallo-dependent hydrolase [Periconia macrospinosa]|uniref:Metallo-dependent hydrolase n=1 Tax=Periconia macrospinosa TaxID=97972 RepID=A0A2V1DN21_9PLEO|nr:Metallo-dependent hydrolase [Periconia macrospinosa]